MAAPKGNRFWEARTKHGRDKLHNPETLWDAAQEYFAWVEDSPLWENKATQYQGVPVDIPIAKMRAMTISGLCLFLDITFETWTQWRKRQDLAEIVAKIEMIIRDQKFTGAAADLLNPNIIAREIGLKEHMEHSGTINTEASDAELMARISELEQRLKQG